MGEVTATGEVMATEHGHRKGKGKGKGKGN